MDNVHVEASIGLPSDKSRSILRDKGVPHHLVYYCSCKQAGTDICYHGVAEVVRVMMEYGKVVRWTGLGDVGRFDADRLSTPGSKVFWLESARSGVSIYGVVKDGPIEVQVETVPGW